MERRRYGGPLYETLEPIITGLGFGIVELIGRQRKNTFHVHLVIHHSDGVDVENCAEVHKTVLPRIEVLYESLEIHLQVSSPGIYRKFKDAREFEIFKGKKVKVLRTGRSEWVKGTIEEADESSVKLTFEEETDQSEGDVVPYAEIQKARLDYP